MKSAGGNELNVDTSAASPSTGVHSGRQPFRIIIIICSDVFGGVFLALDGSWLHT